ncbi:hypothetical protein [Pollutibacter soli]|uniref:hypothetical protein n=1 Tax=Pollutibacter soli TaxID=3034157 RepID=UPI003013F8FC
MSFSLFTYASVLVMLLSCSGSVDTAERKDGSVNTTAPAQPSDTTVYQSPETQIRLTNNSAVIKGAISPGDKPAISVYVDSAVTLSLKLQATDRNGNVRINQIKMPDGKPDGPFGMSIDYPVSQKGNYTIILGQNLMAGDPWTGNWVMTVAIK